MFPLAPDQPPTPSIAFSAQKNPWTIGAAHAEGLTDSIYSNAAWEVQSTPSWMSAGNMVTLTANDFEQGGLTGAPGTSYEDMKFASNNYLRSKSPVSVYGKPVFIRAFVPGFKVLLHAFDANMVYIAGDNLISGANKTVTINISGAVYVIFRLQKEPLSNIAPAEATAAQIGVSVNRFNGNAGTSNLTATVAANTGEARTGNIVLKSLAGSTTYTIPITQQKASVSLNPANIQVGNRVQVGRLITEVTANTSWTIDAGYTSWITPTSYSGAAGTSQMFVDIQANMGAQRTEYITLRSAVNTSATAILSVYQAGATGNISVDTPAFNVDYLTHPVTVNVTSFGTWSVSQRDTWITPSVSTGPNGTTAVTLTIGDNLPAGESARTGTIKFQNNLTGEIATVTVNQGGAPTSIKILPSRVSGPKAGGNRIVPAAATSENNWIMGSAPSWVSIMPTSGGAGQTAIGIKYDTANPGAARTGQLRIENTTTHEIAICLITQEG